jgi:hypothetical protein
VADLAEAALRVPMLVRVSVRLAVVVTMVLVVMVVVSVRAVMRVLVTVATMVVVAVAVSRVRMIVSVVGVPMRLVRLVHRAAAGGVEYVELGGRDAPAGHLARAEIDPLHSERGHVAPDPVQARSQIEQRAHEHVAAHPCGSVEVEDALHLELSLRP